MKKKSSRRSAKAKAKAPKRRRPAKVKAKAKAKKRRTKLKAKAPKRRRAKAKAKVKAPKRRAKAKAKKAPKRRARRNGARRRMRKNDPGQGKLGLSNRWAKPNLAAKALGLSKSSAAQKAKAMGMIKGARKNPGGILGFMKQEVSDFMALAPSIAVQLGTMAAIGFASSKASEQIRKRATAGGAMDKYAGAISSGALTLAAFAAMKMMKSEKSKALTLPVLFGGMAATLVQVLAAVKVDPKKIEGQPAPATPLPKISLGQRLGLPIGEYTAVSGFLDVHGRRIAIDGFGDYVDQPLGALDIHRGRYDEGTVVSMGDYVDQPLGELTLREGRYQEGTVLGEIGQMSEGRQGGRALNSPGDDRVESYIDSGSLSGSVFD
jgi:hypothetical protein